MPLYDWLRNIEGRNNVCLWAKPIDTTLFEGPFHDIEILLSYNYEYIIKSDVIRLFPQRIVNLHISLLPWNRGRSPNFWSFWEDTPKGVTVHLIDEGLDTGDILLQQSVEFDETKETFASTYRKLHETIQTLFRNHWFEIKEQRIQPMKQSSSHTQAKTDRILDKYNIKWSDNIAEVKKKVNEYKATSGRIIQKEKIGGG